VPVPAKPTRPAWRVLVIEDHADTADAMEIVLTRRGYDVRMARSLAEGRRLAQQPFDVLVSDLQLPDGSGLDLMRELSIRGPVKGIAMSGFGDANDVQRSREAGFEHHLVKPVEIQSVIEAIEALVCD
jgi:DNA-binding response OmpR family regulator